MVRYSQNQNTSTDIELINTPIIEFRIITLNPKKLVLPTENMFQYITHF